jgi:hypothetical protein
MVSKLIKFLAIVGLCLPLCGAWPNSGQKYPLVAAAYVGPGDVVASAVVWHGLRAYSNALANAGASTTPVLDVRGDSTATTCTIFLKGTGTGDLDLTTAGAGGAGNQCLLGATTFCTVTNTGCGVSKVYDQSGHATDATQGTAANQPKFILNCIGSLPCLKNTGILYLNLSAASTNQPWTLAMVTLQSGAGTGPFCGAVFGSIASACIAAFSLSTGVAFSSFQGTASINGPAVTVVNTVYSEIVEGNGVNGVVVQNGTAGTPGNAGSVPTSASTGQWLNDSNADHLIGNGYELGIWGIAFNSTQYGNMSANQRAYWGF